MSTAVARQHIDSVYADDCLRFLGLEHYHAGYWADGRYDGDLPSALERHVDALADAARVAHDDVVLDLGCGPGRTSRYLARTRGCRVVGIDLSEAQLGFARAAADEASAASFALMDGCRLGLRDQSVDVVFGIEAFYHFDGKAIALREIHRVLRPGGRVAISDFVVEPGCGRLERLCVAKVVESDSLASVAAYRGWLEQAAFRDVEVDDVSERTAIPTAVALGQPPYRERLRRYMREYTGGVAGRVVEHLDPAIRALWLRAFRSGGARQCFFVATK